MLACIADSLPIKVSPYSLCSTFECLTCYQTVKFSLCGERVPRAEILAEFFKKILQNLHIFDELMIYFVSYVLGLARENSENAISDHLETQNFRNFLKCSAFKVPRAKIILYSLDLLLFKEYEMNEAENILIARL
jgi:hypothetical protein